MVANDQIPDAEAAHELLSALEEQLRAAEPGGLVSAEELPAALVAARDRVAEDLRVTGDWLNSGPAEMLRFGLPEGFEDRWTVEHVGPALTVRWASRYDQVHLKLYASVDRAGKHLRDLEALQPDADELIAAARWARSHDPSEGFLGPLREALAYFGVTDADLSA